MSVFIGEYRYSLDPKGRVFIPARFREEAADGGFVVAKSVDGCLSVYSTAQWLAFCEKLKTLPDIKAREVKRFLFSSATEVEVDAQGRIVIPKTLRDFASLIKEVVIIGVDDRAEIWDEKLYDKMNSEVNREELVKILIESGF